MGSACSTQKALKNVEEPQKFSNEKPKKVLRSSVSKNDQKASSETKKDEHRRSSSSMEKSPQKNQTIHDPVNTSNTSTEDKKSSVVAPKVSNRPLSKYEKRDEHLMSTWGNWLNGHETNKFVSNDEVYYFEMNNFFPDCLFLDIEGDIDMESIVFVRVRGYSTVIATMLQKADYKNDLNFLTSIQIPKSIESDKILFPIIQSLVYSLPEKVDKPFTVTEERRNYFIEGNEDFNNIMKETENALISIEEQNTFPSDFKGSIYMNTCLGMPLLHFAVSKNNMKAVDSLLQLGASPSQRDSNSNTALFYVKSVEMFKKLAEHIDIEVDLFRPNQNEELISHKYCSLYSDDSELSYNLVQELANLVAKSSSPYESILKLFWGLDKQSTTALQILENLYKKKAQKQKYTEEFRALYFNEAALWKIRLNLFKPENVNIIEDRYELSQLEMAVMEENVPLISTYASIGKVDDCRPFVLNYIRSVHVAKMLHRFYPSLFDKREPETSSSRSALSFIIQNMRSGNIPLVTFFVEIYNFKLSSTELIQLIELSLNSGDVELLELVEKVVSNSTNIIGQLLVKKNIDESLKKATPFESNKFAQSPLEYILSIHSDIPHATMLQQVIWKRVKDLCSDDNYRTSLKQQCGYIIQQCLLMRKIEMLKEILTFLKDIGLNHDDLKYKFDSNFTSLKQSDMIYNALTTLLYCNSNLSAILTEDFFTTVAHLASDDGSDAPVLHILVCLFLKKAELKVINKLLQPGYKVETLDGAILLVDEDMKSWIKNWVDGFRDSQFLKRYLLKPYEHADVKKSRKQTERNTSFKLELPKVRRYILLFLIDKNYIIERIEDENFETPNAFEIIEEVSSCIKDYLKSEEVEKQEFLKAVTANLSHLYGRVENDKDFWMRENILIEMEILKGCLGISKPDFSKFNDHSSILQYFKKYYRLNKTNLSIENHTKEFLNADFKDVLLFFLSNSCLHLLGTSLLNDITPAQQLKVSKFLYILGTYNEKNRKDVDVLLEWIGSCEKQPQLLSLLKNAISVGNVKCTKKLISSFMNRNLQLSIQDVSPITESIFSVFRGGCDKLLSSLICEFISLDQILSLKSEFNETPLHSICYGGCTETLQLIHSSLEISEFAKLFLDISYKAGTIEVGEEDSEGEPSFYPTHYLAYLSGKTTIRKKVLTILRELSSKGLVTNFDAIGDWSNHIGALNMIVEHNQEHPDTPLVNVEIERFSFNLLVRGYWMKYYIDNSESFRFDDKFIKLFIYHFVAQRNIPVGSSEITNDRLISCFSGRIASPRNYWTRFFESVLYTSAYENLTTFFFTSIQQGRIQLDEDSLLRLFNLYAKTIKLSGSELIEQGLFDILTFGEEVEDNLISMSVLQNRTRLMKVITTLVEEIAGLKSKILEVKKPLIEKLATLMHPTLENKTADSCLSFFDISPSLYGSETQELMFEFETPRISKNISDDMILANSVGKSIRNWKMERAVDQFIEHIKEETGVMFTVFFFPSLDNLTTPMAQIMTGTTCISCVVETIKPLLEKQLSINTLCVVMNAKQQGFNSNIYENTVEIKMSLSKEDEKTLIVAPFANQ